MDMLALRASLLRIHPPIASARLHRTHDLERRVDVFDLIARALDTPLRSYAAQLVDHVRVELLAVLERLFEGAW